MENNTEKWSQERKFMFLDNVFKPLLHNKMKELGIRGFYYEIWIDLDEQLDDFIEIMYSNKSIAVDLVIKWMMQRDSYYGSSQYTNDLNNMLQDNN